MSDARVGAQKGAGVLNWLSRAPSLAMRSMFGV